MTFRVLELIENLQVAYISCVRKGLKVFGIKHKDIKNYTTTREEGAKKKSKMPDVNKEKGLAKLIKDGILIDGEEAKIDDILKHTEE